MRYKIGYSIRKGKVCEIGLKIIFIKYFKFDINM